MNIDTQRITIAKWIDEYIGRWLIRLVLLLRLSQPRRKPEAIVNKILFIKFWGIGSIILAEPALRYLRKKYPQARIDFLTLSQNQELFALIPHLQQVHTIGFANPLRFILSAALLVPRLRKLGYDLVFDAEFFANFSSLIARMIGVRRIVGFSRAGSIKSKLLHISTVFDDAQHASINFLRLVRSASNGSADTLISRHDESVWPKILIPPSRKTRTSPINKPYIAMNVNASPLALERRWPQNNFAELAKWLLENYKTDLALVGSKAEKEYTAEVGKRIGSRDRVKNLAGELSLIELAETIKASKLFISNDSGPLHLAAALQKPVVGFYGPETPARFGPLCKQRLIFYLGLPCSPCMSVDNAKTVNCTNHLRCMFDLKIETVIPQLRRFIDHHNLLPPRRVSNSVAAI